MLMSPHIECSQVFRMILMWNDEERDYIYMWCPNERWADLTLDPKRVSLWTHGEAEREWRRATRNLSQYKNHTVIELCVVHSCGLMERRRKLQIERSE